MGIRTNSETGELIARNNITKPVHHGQCMLVQGVHACMCVSLQSRLSRWMYTKSAQNFTI